MDEETSTTIQVTKTHEEPGAVQLSVVVEPDRVSEAEHTAAKRYQKQAKLPGFRKGKAPLHVIKRRYSSSIRESVIETLVRAGWETALEQEDLKPIAEPRASNLKFEAGTPVSFDLHVELKPEITIDRAGGFTVQRTKTPVTEDAVREQLDRIRDQRGPWVPLEDERPKSGDLVKIRLTTLEENAAAGDPQPFELVLGQGRALADVEALVTTLSPGETAEGDVTYPDDFADESKRGTSRKIRVSLDELKRQQLPELTDDFAREVGDFDTLSALKDAIREDLGADAAREADSRVRSELIQRVIEANNVPAPKGLVDRALLMLAHAYGITEDQWEHFTTEFRTVAERQVQRDLVIDRLASDRSLHATKEEVEERIKTMAERRNQPPAELRALLEREKRLRDLERGITEERVFEYLLSQSTINEE